MKTTRSLVDGGGKLTAGVEFGHGQFEGGNTGGVDVGRDTAAVVGDGDQAAGVEENGNVLGIAADGFVKGVIKNLDQEVVETFFIGTADEHAGPFPDRFQALENGDVFGGVSVG